MLRNISNTESRCRVAGDEHKRTVRHQTNSATPNEQCDTKRTVRHQTNSATPNEQCGTKRTVRHQTNSATPNEQCDTKPRTLLQFTCRD